MADSQTPQSPSDKPQQPPAAKSKSGMSIGRIIAAPFVVIGHLVRGKTKIDEVIVYSAPAAFFLWVVIAVGFLLNLLVPTNILTLQAGAWIFIFTLIYFLLAILYDMSLKKVLLCTLVVAVLWLFAKYMEGRYSIAILSPILHHFAALDPKYDHGTVSVICWLLLIPWVASLFEMAFKPEEKIQPE